MGPFLYSMIRFLKPTYVCECGAGYTSVFITQALADNQEEVEMLQKIHRTPDGDVKPGVKFCLEGFMSDPRSGTGKLHCVDNMAHEHTTATLVQQVAEEL